MLAAVEPLLTNCRQRQALREAEVEDAFVSAVGSRDIDCMRRLWEQHPEWLHLGKVRCQEEDGSMHGREELMRPFTHRFRLETVGGSALHAAAWTGYEDGVAFLLERGQDANAVDANGMTAIMVALMRHNLQEQRLIFAGRTPVRRTSYLNLTAESQNRLRETLSIVTMLIKAGGDVNQQSLDKKTAMHLVITDDLRPVAELLIGAGADCNAQDDLGQTPMHLCVKENMPKTLDTLVQGLGIVDIPDKKGESVLSLVVSKDWAGELAYLLDFGRSLSGSRLPDCHHTLQQLLTQCIMANAIKCTRHLLEAYSLDLNYTNEKGETYLHLALARRASETRQLVLSHVNNQHLHLTTSSGDGYLHYAAKFGTVQDVGNIIGYLKRCGTQEQDHVAEKVGKCTQKPRAPGINRVNMARETALFVLSRTTRSEQRRKKARVLIAEGARLLPAGGCWRTCLPWSALWLAAGARRWLKRMVLETTTPTKSYTFIKGFRTPFGGSIWKPMGAERINTRPLTDLCEQWVACLDGSKTPAITPLLALLVHYGHAIELLSVLVELPLARDRVDTFFSAFHQFAKREDHPFLLQFHAEAVGNL